MYNRENEEFGTEVKFGYVENSDIKDGFYQYVDYKSRENCDLGLVCLDMTGKNQFGWDRKGRKSPFKLSWNIRRSNLIELNSPAMKILFGI